MRVPLREWARRGLPQSSHFRLEQVSERAYAAIAREGGGAFANAGIVDLGERTLVFDTFLTPQAASDLRAAAEHLFGRPVTLVVNSHWHGDHVRGNQVFADAEIVGTSRTRELIATAGRQRLDEARRHAESDLPALREQLDRERDEARRGELAAHLEVASSLAGLDLVLPTRVFGEGMVVAGGATPAELLTYGGGHTESDAFLVLRADGVAFLGDLLVTESHAWIGDGDPREWRLILDRVETLGMQTLVGGHGRVGAAADLHALRDYLDELERVAAELVGNGATADQLAAAPVPARFRGWQWPDVFGRNMRFLGERLRVRA